MNQPKHIFPKPPINTYCNIHAIVVEKCGDDYDDSTRPKEIWVFSPELIKGDGLMILPKRYWRDVELGDWLSCSRVFCENRRGVKTHERELLPEMLIRDEYELEYRNLPPSVAHNLQVKINTKFVLCPSFIANDSIRRNELNKKKLIMLDIGQAFVTVTRYSNPIANCIADQVYRGIFEYRGNGYGAVNFAKNDGEKDSTGHFIEPNCYWELVEIITLIPKEDTAVGYDFHCIPIIEDPRMRKYISKLKQEATNYTHQRQSSQPNQPIPLVNDNKRRRSRSERSEKTKKSTKGRANSNSGRYWRDGTND